MKFFQRFLGKKSSSKKTSDSFEERGKFMPEIKIPLDEKFTINFNSNGGKFLYCENFQEVIKNLYLIMEENKWTIDKTLIYDTDLKHIFNGINFPVKTDNVDFFLSTCEYLIADDGSILICSKQLAENKLKELPENMVIFSKTSQIVKNIGDGLRGIKKEQKLNDSIPSNITTIKHFKKDENQDENFMSYGSSCKNLYLLLLEDL